MFRQIRGTSVVSHPPRFSELDEAGALLPGPGATLVGPTFEERLDAQEQSINR